MSLRSRLHAGEPAGYLRGKSLMRDLIAHELGVSELEAESLVDTLEMHGFVRFLGDPTDRSRVDASWDIDPDHV